MVEGLHDSHLHQQFLVFLLAQRGFLDLFGRAIQTSIFGKHFVNLTEPAAADLLDDDIVVEVVALLHLDKTIPFDFYLLALPALSLRLLHQQILLLVHSSGQLGRDGVLLLAVHVVALVHRHRRNVSEDCLTARLRGFERITHLPVAIAWLGLEHSLRIVAHASSIMIINTLRKFPYLSPRNILTTPN